MSDWKVSPVLAHAIVRAAYRNYLKYLVYGPPKGGKSTVLAHTAESFLRRDSGEVVILDGGGGGILPYLDIGQPRLHVFTLFPRDLKAELSSGGAGAESEALKRLMKEAVGIANEVFNLLVARRNEVTFVGCDEFDDLWSIVVQHEEFRQGVDEIKGGGWKFPKGVWKRYLRILQWMNCAVGLTAKHKDVLYEDKKTPTGQSAGLDIRAQDVPAIEKNTPYTIDMILKADVKRDQMMRPTHLHTLKLMGFRRPRTVPPEQMFTGQEWEFNSKKPENVWDKVFAQWAEEWSKGVEIAETGGQMDAQEIEEATAEAVSEAQSATFGQLSLRLAGAASLPQLKKIWDDECKPAQSLLRADEWIDLSVRKDRRKAELAGRAA